MIAMYPGSFDPPTHGHRAIARRAANDYTHLIVAVGVNAFKCPSFLFLFAGEPNVSVCAYAGWTALQARVLGACRHMLLLTYGREAGFRREMGYGTLYEGSLAYKDLTNKRKR